MLNASKLKSWARANRVLATSVLKAQVFAASERARVDAYIAPVFATFAFIDSDDGTPITDPHKLYNSDDEAKCDAYYAACDVTHRSNGYTGQAGTCPALVAENDAIKLENELLRSLSALMGVDGFYKLELRAKALELAMTSAINGLK